MLLPLPTGGSLDTAARTWTDGTDSRPWTDDEAAYAGEVITARSLLDAQETARDGLVRLLPTLDLWAQVDSKTATLSAAVAALIRTTQEV